MKLKQNEGTLDRVIRLVVGLVLIAVAYAYLSGWVAIVFYVVAAIALITAATGFCGLYALLKISTKEKQLEKKPGEQPGPPKDSGLTPNIQ